MNQSNKKNILASYNKMSFVITWSTWLTRWMVPTWASVQRTSHHKFRAADIKLRKTATWQSTHTNTSLKNNLNTW